MNATPQLSPRSVSRLYRRQIVLLYAAGILTISALQFCRLVGVFDQLHGSARVPLLFLYLAGFGLILFSAWKFTFPARLGLPQGHSRDMDERQLLRLNQATTTAYRLVSLVLLVIAGTFIWWGSNLSGLAARPDGISGLMFMAIFVLPHLPTAILAWTEPDEIE